MSYMQTDIFDDFAKIAKERGLISESSDEESNKTTQDISSIEVMYGVKPNGEDDDILDKAHPTSVVIAPAHDRVNGLVENLKERHKVMTGIALKPTNGLLTQHRYVEAKKSLLDEVVKIGFLLDKNDETELMVFADGCAEQLTKTAFYFLIFPAIAALIGGGIYTSHNPSTQGLKQDAQRALEKVNDVSSDEEYKVLGQILSPVSTNLQKFIMMMDKFVENNDQLILKLLSVSSAITPEDKKAAIESNAVEFFRSGKDQEVLSTFKQMKDIADALIASIPLAVKELDTIPNQHREKDSTLWRSIKDLSQKVWQPATVDAKDMLLLLKSSLLTLSQHISEQNSNLDKLRDTAIKSGVNVKPSKSDIKSDVKSNTKSEKPKSSLPSWA